MQDYSMIFIFINNILFQLGIVLFPTKDSQAEPYLILGQFEVKKSTWLRCEEEGRCYPSGVTGNAISKHEGKQKTRLRRSLPKSKRSVSCKQSALLKHGQR
jgi:hypothetical protein